MPCLCRCLSVYVCMCVWRCQRYLHDVVHEDAKSPTPLPPKPFWTVRTSTHRKRRDRLAVHQATPRDRFHSDVCVPVAVISSVVKTDDNLASFVVGEGDVAGGGCPCPGGQGLAARRVRRPTTPTVRAPLPHTHAEKHLTSFWGRDSTHPPTVHAASYTFYGEKSHCYLMSEGLHEGSQSHAGCRLCRVLDRTVRLFEDSEFPALW